MDVPKVILEKKDGIGYITLNNPETRNVVTGLGPDLVRYIDECSDDPNVRVVVLRGAGSVFSAGGNIKVMKERIETGQTDSRPSLRELGTVIIRLRNLRKPVVASIQGAAAGAGLSLALACDFRIVAEDAKFIFAFTNMGLIPDCGAPLPLIRMVGISRATELLMTAKPFSGKEAYDWGMVNEAVPLDQLEETTMKFAKKLAHGPTVAYGMVKTMVNRLAYSGIELELDNEAEYQNLCYLTEDHKEGVDAFLEKRKPLYKGR